MKRNLLLLLATLVILVGAISVAAQEEQPAQAEGTEKTEAAKPAKHAMAAAKAETLSGTLSMVDADKKLVVVAANGIPYNFVVSSGTKITVGGSKAKLADLSSDTSKQVSVTFMALKKKGNIAKSIEVTQ